MKKKTNFLEEVSRLDFPYLLLRLTLFKSVHFIYSISFDFYLVFDAFDIEDVFQSFDFSFNFQ